MLYIRHPKRDVWHFVVKCRHWQVLVQTHGMGWLARRDRKPKSGELCNQCQAKARR